MAVRPHLSREGEWVIDCRPDGYKGKRKRFTFVGTETEAKTWERQIMRRHVNTANVTSKSLSGLFPIWIAYYRLNRAASTVKDVQGTWPILREHFGKLQPKVITRQLIEKYKQTRLEQGVKPRTINKELSYLSVFLKWAAENDYADPLPFAIPKFPGKMTKAPKPRVLLPEQITAMFKVIEPEYRLAFLLMADAGLRISEAMNLTREQVELDSGLIFVTGKGSKERIVPITTDRLKNELLKHKDKKGWLTVNPSTGKPYVDIKKALPRAAKKAGITKHINHHLLRHSFGTSATMAGYDLSALQSIMGHSSPETTGIYQHLAGEYLRSQGRKLDKLVKSQSIKIDKE